MNENRIAILGGGPAAHAYAARLTLKGFEINLCELTQFAEVEHIKRTLQTQEIEVSGVVSGRVKLNMVTTDIGKAIKDAKAVFLTARSNADRLFAEICAPHLQDGQIVVLTPGNCGSLEFLQVLKEKQIKKDVLLAESAVLGQGVRFLQPSVSGGPTHVKVFFLSGGFGTGVGVFPAKRTDEAINHLKKIFPETVGATNVLESGMSNPNPISHIAPTILNIGRIETADSFAFHLEAFSKSVVKVSVILGKERVSILNALGLRERFPIPDSEDNFLERHFPDCGPKDGLEECWREDALKGPLANPSQSRYITEDVPNGFVFYSSLAEMLGVKVPNIDAFIQIASAINQVDYKAIGRTVKTLGIDGMTAKQLTDFLYNGV